MNVAQKIEEAYAVELPDLPPPGEILDSEVVIAAIFATYTVNAAAQRKMKEDILPDLPGVMSAAARLDATAKALSNIFHVARLTDGYTIVARCESLSSAITDRRTVARNKAAGMMGAPGIRAVHAGGDLGVMRLYGPWSGRYKADVCPVDPSGNRLVSLGLRPIFPHFNLARQFG